MEERTMEERAMKPNLTELVFILDRSGSMGGMESDTIGGYNSFLKKQQEQAGECRITTVLFDGEYEVLHDRLDLQAVSPITEKEYYVRGNTALLDAIGKSINKIGNAQKHSKEEYRADKVLFVITTDGMENASREFAYGRIKQMIEHQKSRHGWEFIFLGANIDAVETARRFGIAGNRAHNFHNDSAGVGLNFRVVSEAAAAFRGAPCGVPLADDWGKEIEDDYLSRGGDRK
jgi:uncharacterized protein YegL